MDGDKLRLSIAAASASPSTSNLVAELQDMDEHILVVDDDPDMRELINVYLSENDFRVTEAEGGIRMDEVLHSEGIDLVILDLRLRGEDGMQLARELRAANSVPVIIVSGKQDEADRVMGLELAADDYITKPFSNRELLARVRSVLRRYAETRQNLVATSRNERRAYRFLGWELNVLARRLTSPNASRVELSNGEFNLLLAICAAPQRALSRDQLLELSRLHGAEVYDRTIDVQILRLRRKIEVDAAEPKLIRTERGVGYLFDAVVEVLT